MHKAVQMGLQVVRAHAGQRDAVLVTEFDHRVAMRIGGDQRPQLLHVWNVDKMVELDGVSLRIKVGDGGGWAS